MKPAVGGRSPLRELQPELEKLIDVYEDVEFLDHRYTNRYTAWYIKHYTQRYSKYYTFRLSAGR